MKHAARKLQIKTDILKDTRRKVQNIKFFQSQKHHRLIGLGRIREGKV